MQSHFIGIVFPQTVCLHHKYLLPLRDQQHQDGSSAKSRWSKYLVKKSLNVCLKILIAVLLKIISEGRKQPKCPPIRHWVNKLQYINTVEDYEAFTKYLYCYSMTSRIYYVKKRYRMVCLICYLL